MNKVIQGHGEIVCESATNKNCNTFTLILNDLPSDRSFPYFDTAGLIIGRGAACSSGAKKPSQTLLALGYKDLAEHGLRFSFDPSLLVDNYEDYSLQIISVLKKIITI